MGVLLLNFCGGCEHISVVADFPFSKHSILVSCVLTWGGDEVLVDDVNKFILSNVVRKVSFIFLTIALAVLLLAARLLFILAGPLNL